MAEMIRIDDNNYRNFVNPTVDGQVMHCASSGVWGGGTPQGYGGTFADLKSVPLIPEGEWKDRIRQLQKDKAELPTFADEMGLGIRNQKNSNFCWAFGTCRSAELAMLQTTGDPVHISPFSVGAPIKNFRNRGGWGDEALDFMAANGFNFVDEWPSDGASSISRRYYTAENKEKAAKRKVLEYYKLTPGRTGWAQLVSCILAGYGVAVGFNWWGHLVCGTSLTLDLDLIIDNSWGTNWSDNGRGILTGRKKYPDGAVVITTVMAA